MPISAIELANCGKQNEKTVQFPSKGLQLQPPSQVAQIFVVLTMLAPHSSCEPPEIGFFTASVEPPFQKNILTFFAKITV
jgi:hypothetical protein